MWERHKDWRLEDVLAQQLAMNPQTWQVLQTHGVAEDTELRLDFSYEAPDRASGDALASFLSARRRTTTFK